MNLRAFAILLATFAAGPALAQPVVSLTPLQPTTKLWRERLDFRIDVAGTCAGAPAAGSTSDLVLPTLTSNTALTGVACNAGVLSADPTVLTNQEPYLWIGTHPVFARASVATSSGIATAESRRTVVFVVPDASLAGPGGPVEVALADPFGQACTARSYARDDAEGAPVPRPPTAKGVSYGYVSFDVSGCGALTAPAWQFFLLREPGGFPPGAELWIHDTSQAGPGWRLANPVQDSGQLESQAFGDARGVRATLAIAYPNRDSFLADVNGLWWGGPDQDGWGVDVSRTDDRVFAAAFIHDANAQPRWVVMPAGRWDAMQLAYTGDLYAPSGRPFVMGAPVGRAVLAFDDAAHGRLDYTLGSLQGAKSLVRFDIAGSSPAQSHSGLWWSPAFAGEGLSIRTVGNQVFATWYSYDPTGDAAWYDMPGGAWNGTTFEGALYRTTGTPWAGTRATATFANARAGTLSLDFAAPDAVGMRLSLGATTTSRVLQRFSY